MAGAKGIPVMEEDMVVEDMEGEVEGEDSLQHSIVEVVEVAEAVVAAVEVAAGIAAVVVAAEAIER